MISGTVLLVNAPNAADAVLSWRKAAPPADLGWHPCLTLDSPIMPANRVRSLVDREGRFHRLGSLMARLLMGRVHYSDLVLEFRAQLDRFRVLTGHNPLLVNSHHHIQVFPIVGAALREVLGDCAVQPYLRRVREPFATLRQIRGARTKRSFLSILGRRESEMQSEDGFAGADWLAGITDPPYVHDPMFFTRWLRQATGDLVELTCHPGDYDETLLGRDAVPGDGNLKRRVQELELLRHPDFPMSWARAGFRLVQVSELVKFDRELRRAG